MGFCIGGCLAGKLLEQAPDRRRPHPLRTSCTAPARKSGRRPCSRTGPTSPTRWSISTCSGEPGLTSSPGGGLNSRVDVTQRRDIWPKLKARTIRDQNAVGRSLPRLSNARRASAASPWIKWAERVAHLGTMIQGTLRARGAIRLASKLAIDRRRHPRRTFGRHSRSEDQQPLG